MKGCRDNVLCLDYKVSVVICFQDALEISKLSLESVIQVTGTVQQRPKGQVNQVWICALVLLHLNVFVNV